MMSLQDEIEREEFLENLILENYNRQTVIGIKEKLGRLFEYLEEKDIRLEEVRVKEAQGFQGWLIETGRRDGRKYAKGSIHNFIKAATLFYHFLKKKGCSFGNPFVEIKKVRLELKLPRNILKEKEMNALLEELSCFDEAEGFKSQARRYRVHVISELMYSTGLRISEVASLRQENIDFQSGTVELRDSKGRKNRRAFLNEYAKGVLELYVKEMRALVMNEVSRKELLFGAGGGRLLTMVNQELKDASDSLGFGPITSHGFRHAVGYHLLRAGCDIRYIQDILGHEKLRNTEIYTRVDKEDLKEVLDRYHPRRFKRIRDEEA